MTVAVDGMVSLPIPPRGAGSAVTRFFFFLEACFLGGVGHRLGIIQTLFHLFPSSFALLQWVPMCIFIATFSFHYDTQARIQPWHFTSPFLILVKFIRSYELQMSFYRLYYISTFQLAHILFFSCFAVHTYVWTYPRLHTAAYFMLWSSYVRMNFSTFWGLRKFYFLPS